MFGLRRWSRRMFAFYVVVTILGGAVLVGFLTVMGLLYWMQARVPLPDPQRLIHPDAVAFLVARYEKCDSPARPPLPFSTRLVTRGLPHQAARLIEKGAKDLNCGFQVVVSLVPRNDGRDATVAISLGAYPGLFRIVRPDLERQCEKGVLNYGLHYHQEKAVFSGPGPGLNVLSLARCSVLRSTSIETMEALLDGLTSDASLKAPASQAGAVKALPNRSFSAWGWARSWADMELDEVSQTTDMQALLEFKKALGRDIPSITQLHDVQFSMDSSAQKLSVSFQPGDPSDGPSIAAALSGWLEQNGPRLGLSAPSVEFSDGRVKVWLGLEEVKR